MDQLNSSISELVKSQADGKADTEIEIEECKASIQVWTLFSLSISLSLIH
jgi:hypothetical protein